MKHWNHDFRGLGLALLILSIGLAATGCQAVHPRAAALESAFAPETAGASLAEAAPIRQDEEEAEEEDAKSWEATVEGAIAVSGGNTQKSDVDIKAEYKQEWENEDTLTAFARAEWGDSKKESGDRERTTNRQTAGAEYRHMLDAPLFAFLKEALEKDEDADIKFQSDTFAGVGSRLVKNDEHELNAQVGAGYTTTSRYEGENDDDPSGLLAQDWAWKINEDWELVEAFELIPNLNELDDDFRTTTTADLKTDITENMFISFGVEHRYDAEPAADVKRQDWEVKLKLGIKF